MTRILIFGAIIFLSACGPAEQQRQAERRRVEQDRNSAAFKAGRAAHEVAREAGKAAAAAGRALDKNARKLDEGWREQAREDREKQKR